MINLDQVYVSFTKEYDALHNINLAISSGEKIAVCGDADSGKTTLLRVIANLETVTSGGITINNIPVEKINFKQDVQLGYVPKVVVFKHKKTVFENLRYVLKIRGYDDASINFKILSALKTFAIDSIKNVPIESLTPKQKMLVQLARVSMRRVDIFLIDNITKNLSKEEQADVLKALKTLMDLNPESTFVIAFDNEKMAKELNLKIYKLKLGSLEKAH